MRVALEYIDIDRNDTRGLRAWHDLYLQSFPHVDEQEPLEAFKHILEMNDNQKLQSRFGSYHEQIIAIRRAADFGFGQSCL